MESFRYSKYLAFRPRTNSRLKQRGCKSPLSQISSLNQLVNYNYVGRFKSYLSGKKPSHAPKLFKS